MGIKVWIYFENGATIDIQGIAGVSNTLLGFDIKQEFITEDEDDTLSDPANGAIANEIPGATRYKLTVDKIVQSPGGGFATAQVPLASSVGEKTPYFAKVVSGTLLYLNGHSVQVG